MASVWHLVQGTGYKMRECTVPPAAVPGHSRVSVAACGGWCPRPVHRKHGHATQTRPAGIDADSGGET